MDGICPGRRGRFRGRSRYGAIIYEAYHVAFRGSVARGYANGWLWGLSGYMDAYRRYIG